MLEGDMPAPLWVSTTSDGTSQYSCINNPDILSFYITRTDDALFMDIFYPDSSTMIAEHFLETESAFVEGDVATRFPHTPNIGMIGTGSNVYGMDRTKAAIAEAIAFIDGISPLPEEIKRSISRTLDSAKAPTAFAARASASDRTDISELLMRSDLATAITNQEQPQSYRERITIDKLKNTSRENTQQL